MQSKLQVQTKSNPLSFYMRYFGYLIFSTAIVLLMIMQLTGCSGSDSAPEVESAASDTNDTTDTVTTTDANDTTDSPTTLSEQEELGIYFMREEEKLARDVYLKLFDQWGLNVFSNISDSEQSHMDAVLSLINRYDLTDPAKDSIGEFTDQELQNLYNDLMAQGMSDPLNALWVGALIEETDIQDIVEWMEQTDNTDIFLVYESLLCGSRNHLRAFVKQIEANGGPYSIQIPEIEQEVNDILNSSQEQCD